MWNPFKKTKSVYLGITATSEPFPATAGFSYNLKVPNYLEIPSRKTGIKLVSPSLEIEPDDKALVLSTLVILEAVVFERDIVRFIFAQKYASNQSVTVGKFHYLLCKEDYVKRRLRSSSLELGSIHRLIIFFDDKTNREVVTDSDWRDFDNLFNDGRFDSFFRDMEKCFSKSSLLKDT